ncbi:hypothetical protein NDU88_002510 [Pleurodeles waltl]|uniref:Uncharacterized protein n=1 Tax=Pleurodeles waltl TaxID=8319 RepID=A0AAV7Q688_PLEWA|nr:hypothetical protein NDU88_002510 [Pleurodeles waltl]
MSSGGSHISSAIRGVRSGPPVNGEREELDPLRSELLSLRSASFLVSGCEHANVLTSFKACVWSFAICDFVGRVKMTSWLMVPRDPLCTSPIGTSSRAPGGPICCRSACVRAVGPAPLSYVRCRSSFNIVLFHSLCAQREARQLASRLGHRQRDVSAVIPSHLEYANRCGSSACPAQLLAHFYSLGRRSTGARSRVLPDTRCCYNQQQRWSPARAGICTSPHPTAVPTLTLTSVLGCRLGRAIQVFKPTQLPGRGRLPRLRCRTGGHHRPSCYGALTAQPGATLDRLGWRVPCAPSAPQRSHC